MHSNVCKIFSIIPRFLSIISFYFLFHNHHNMIINQSSYCCIVKIRMIVSLKRLLVPIVEYWKWPLRPLWKFIGLYKTADHAFAIPPSDLSRAPHRNFGTKTLPSLRPLRLVMKDLDSAKRHEANTWKCKLGKSSSCIFALPVTKSYLLSARRNPSYDEYD